MLGRAMKPSLVLLPAQARAVSAAISVLVLSSGCSSVQTRVRGELLVHPPEGSGAPRSLRYEAIEPHSIMGTAAACLFTGIFYGGACWAYLAAPYDSQEALALEHARADARRIGRCAELVDVQPVERAGWDAAPRSVTITNASGQVLTPPEVEALCRADVSASPP